MKKNILLTLFVFTAFSAWSQNELHLTASSLFYISPTTYVHSDIDVKIVSGGDLTIASSATDSGSFLVPGGSGVTGDITYLRYVSGRTHLISAPVQTQDITTFITTNSTPRIGYYDNIPVSGPRWVMSPTGPFTTGEGYGSDNDGAADQVYTFTGTMNTTDNFSVTIPKTASGVPVTEAVHMWSAVGNPYPSFLPANIQAGTDTGLGGNILTANASLLNANRVYLYVLTATGYVIYNNASPNASGANYLVPGQAFMVDAVADNSSFMFPESLQTVQPSGVSTPLLRTSPTPEITIKLSNDSTEKNTRLIFLDKTTKGLDPGYDAGTFNRNGAALDIATHLVSESDGIRFKIQCLPNNDFETSVVSLSVNAVANQTLTFSTDVANLPTGLKVYLEDKVANTVTDITTASHQLTNTVALNGIGRFYLHTTESTLNVDDLASINNFNMYKTSNINLRVTGLQQQGTALVNMYTTTGKQVLSNSFTIQTVNDISLPNNLAKGIYLVNVVTSTTKQTKKIIIE